ncbi:MAG: site-specific DNA-methyltransferase [Armatimonadetes bacterium]|nr:MAG: site-specific DNA-methyltransferase [Armatimonadota bacterium]
MNIPSELESWLDKIVCADALETLPQLPSESVDLVLTDPPYFLDKLDNEWTPERAARRYYQSQAVFHLPPGMKFDPSQGRRMYEWYLEVSRELYRVLKPGGFFFSFASPRLYHRVATAIEDAGFHIRDCFLWLYTQNQPKAMTLYHFIDKMQLSESTKADLKQRIAGWKTPQVKSCFEPIIIAQKPYEDTFLENFLRHGVGLFNTEVRIGQNMFPANVLLVEGVEAVLDKYFLVPKPSVEERGSFNQHPTAKPLALCEYLIKLSTVEGAVVLDPFLGSGTTALAARSLKRHFIGIEINPEYVAIAQRRLQNAALSLFADS